MKKIRSIFCTGILSILLVGNVFATTTITINIATYWDSIVEYLTSFSENKNDCPVRDCQQGCKPNTNCRPDN